MLRATCICQIIFIFVYKLIIMPEVLVKYKNEKAFKALQDLAKDFDISIGTPTPKLPITYAESPDVTALAGIWEGKDINLEQLRKEAWGDRI